MVPGPDCREDGKMCPNGIHHAARSVSAWLHVGVHCHGSEQCHVIVCASAAVLNSLTKMSKCSTVGISIDGCVAGHETNMGKRSLLSEQPTCLSNIS